MVKTAVILAAGLGTRFGSRTELLPKGFVEVNGKAMIIRSIENLLACGIERIIIGTGYKKEVYEHLKTVYPQIECCYSEHYAETNSMWTLYNTREVIGEEDFLLLESDLIYEPKALSSLIHDPHPDVLLCTEVTKFQDQYYVEYNAKNELVHCSVVADELSVCGEFVGIHKLSSSFYKALCNYYEKIKNEKPKLGYEFAMLYIARHFIPLHVLKISGLKWYEIDDEKDLVYAEKLRIAGD